MTTACAAEAVQEYTLHSRAAGGSDQLLGVGTTTGTFGAFSSAGNGLAYVALSQAVPGPRGPAVVDRSSPSALWFWNVADGPRAKLVEAQNAITALAP
jgi:hypothetical protein